MKWTRRTNEERGIRYVDWYSDDDEWIIAEGYDEPARKAGNPYALMHREVTKRSGERLVKIDCFPTVAEAKQAAEVM